MAHCLAGRSHRRLLTDIIAGRCVSGATGNVLVPSEDDVSTGMIPRVRNVCHALPLPLPLPLPSSSSASRAAPTIRCERVDHSNSRRAIEPLHAANGNTACLKRERETFRRLSGLPFRGEPGVRAVRGRHLLMASCSPLAFSRHFLGDSLRRERERERV